MDITEATCPGCTRVISRIATRCPFCTCEIETVQVGKGTNWAYKQGWIVGIISGGFLGGMLGMFFYQISLGAIIGAVLCGWIFSLIGRKRGITVRQVKGSGAVFATDDQVKERIDAHLRKKLPTELMERYGVTQDGDSFYVNGAKFTSPSEACTYGEKFYFAKHGVTFKDNLHYYEGLPYTTPAAVWEKIDQKVNANSNSNEEVLWEKAAQELESSNRKEGLWVKCYAQAQGDENKAKALYYDARVRQFAAEVNASPDKEEFISEPLGSTQVKSESPRISSEARMPLPLPLNTPVVTDSLKSNQNRFVIGGLAIVIISASFYFYNKQETTNPKVEELIKKNNQFVYACNEKQNKNSCEMALKTYKELKSKGYCWGKENQPRSDYDWHKCDKDSIKEQN